MIKNEWVSSNTDKGKAFAKAIRAIDNDDVFGVLEAIASLGDAKDKEWLLDMSLRQCAALNVRDSK